MDEDEVLDEIEKTLAQDEMREGGDAGNSDREEEENLISETVMRGRDWNIYDFASFLDTIYELDVEESFLENAKKSLETRGPEVAAKLLWVTLRGHLINEEYKKRRRDRAKDPVKKAESMLKKIQAKKEKLRAEEEAAEKRIGELRTSKKRKPNPEFD